MAVEDGLVLPGNFEVRDGVPTPSGPINVSPSAPTQTQTPAAGVPDWRAAEMSDTTRAAISAMRDKSAATRLAEALTAAQAPQRADRSKDLLTSSLSAPLLSTTDQYGQTIPLMVSRPSARPWAEMTPTRTVIAYSEDDVIAPATWTVEERARLQRRLVNAGVLDPANAQYGMFDAATQAAYKDLLVFASSAGMTQLEALQEYDRAKKWAAEQGIAWGEFTGGEAGARFTAPKYEAPDAASIAQAAKAVYSERLGREPTSAELEAFSEHMMGVDRDTFGAQAAALGMPVGEDGEPGVIGVFDETTAAWGSAEPGAAAEGGSAGRGVDVEARYAEGVDDFFNSRYKHAMANRRDTAEQASLSGQARGLFSTASEAI